MEGGGLSDFCAWGIPGDLPVPAGYKADMAMDPPSEGSWWVINRETRGFGWHMEFVRRGEMRELWIEVA